MDLLDLHVILVNFSISKDPSALKTKFRATEWQQRQRSDISLKPLFCNLVLSKNFVLNAVLIAAGQNL